MTLPILKWAGGKRKLLSKIKPLWEQHVEQVSAASSAETQKPRLVEPFCGGAAVALGLAPQRALLNDLNPHLINFYNQLQQDKITRTRFEYTEGDYYEVRDIFNDLIQTDSAFNAYGASLFYYLNRTGFNGLVRFNRSGEFNVPMGKYKKVVFKTAEELSEYAQIMREWVFSKQDFSELETHSSDFIYADPPYDETYSGYTPNKFGWQDQQRLAEWLISQAGAVVASNAATARVLEMYQDLGFEVEVFDQRHVIAANKSKRKPVKEMLAVKVGF